MSRLAGKFARAGGGAIAMILGAASSSLPPRPFRYAGRWASLGLLLALVFLGFLSLLSVLWGILAVANPAAYESTAIFHQLVTLGWTVAFLLSGILFLIWLFLVHRDLNRSYGAYPISPIGALARVSVPVVSLWGYFNVFFTLAEELPVKLNALTVISFALLFAGNLVGAESSQLESPSALLFFAISLVLAAVWFLMTSRVHKAMAGIEERSLVANRAMAANRAGVDETDGGLEPAAEVATVTASSTATAADASEIAPAPVAVQPVHRGMSRWLKIALIVGALAACGIFAIGAIYVPRIVEGVVAFQKEWYDESYDQLNAALSERSGPDDSIPNATADFEYRTYGEGQSEVWFVIDLETTTPCTLREEGDPCKALAYEFAGIVLENYPRVDDLDGLQIIVTKVDDAGVVEFTRSVDASWSIPEWRRELGIAKVDGDA